MKLFATNGENCIGCKQFWNSPVANDYLVDWSSIFTTFEKISFEIRSVLIINKTRSLRL